MSIDNLDPRLKDIIIKRGGKFGTTFLVDEWEIPNEEIEYYYVFYKNIPIATFWVSNNCPDSIKLNTPMDIPLLEYIISQMKVREFPRKTA